MEQSIEYTEAEARYAAAFERVQALVPQDVWWELDDARGELMMAHEGEVLGHLVIGVSTPGSFPAVAHAVRIVEAERVDLDQCEHHYLAAMQAVFGPGIGEAFELLARAELERSFGNATEAEELTGRAWALTNLRETA